MQEGNPHEVIHLACRELATWNRRDRSDVYIHLGPSTGHEILSSNLAASSGTLNYKYSYIDRWWRQHSTWKHPGHLCHPCVRTDGLQVCYSMGCWLLQCCWTVISPLLIIASVCELNSLKQPYENVFSYLEVSGTVHVAECPFAPWQHKHTLFLYPLPAVLNISCICILRLAFEVCQPYMVTAWGETRKRNTDLIKSSSIWFCYLGRVGLISLTHQFMSACCQKWIFLDHFFPWLQDQMDKYSYSILCLGGSMVLARGNAGAFLVASEQYWWCFEML